MQAHQAVQDRGTCTSIGGLHEEPRTASGSEGGIELLMLLGDNRYDSVRADNLRHPTQRLTEQRLGSEHSAKLFGPVVSGDPPGKWQQPLALTSGKDDSPSMVRREGRISLRWYLFCHFSFSLCGLIQPGPVVAILN